MPFPNLVGLEPEYSDEDACKKIQEYLEQDAMPNQKVPTVHGLALWMDVSSRTIMRYVKDEEHFPQFCQSYKRMLDAQAEGIIDNSLKNKYNANISKLLLYNHGYVDKSQVDSKIDSTVNQKNDTTINPSDALKELLDRITKVQTE